VLGGAEIDDGAGHRTELSVRRRENDHLPLDTIALDIHLSAVFKDEDSRRGVAAIAFGKYRSRES
jgi:hypothetical protein